MSTYFKVQPEVAGQLGPNTIMDTSVHPPRVYKLQYLVDGWLGDDIVESFPCFVITGRLSDAILNANLAGYQFGRVECLFLRNT